MRRLQFLLLVFFFQLTIKSIGQTNKTDVATFCKEFFKTEEPLEMTIISDFKHLKSQKKKGVYQPGYTIVKFTAKDSVADSVRICTRGEYRRGICQMPSLMLNFKNNKTSPLSKLKKLKMVCGCNSSDYNERLVLMEYLVYKIYNVLTDMSFNVRLAKTTYKDQNNKLKPLSQYSFFIEDVDDLAKRNNCKEYEKKASALYSDRNQTTMMTIFQYMIGNTDWSVPNYHNVKLLQPVNDTIAYPFIVPYDFDFSGLVNAPYAFPNNEMFTIEKVTDRFYRGLPRNPQEVDLVLDVFKASKQKIIQTIKNFEILEKNDRETMIRYLEEFYTTINNKNMVDYHFVKGMKQ